MFNRFFTKRTFSTKIAILIAIASFFAAITTYWVMSQDSRMISPNSSLISGLLFTDLVLFLALTIFVSKKFLQIYAKKNQHIIGTKLQTKILIFFCLLASIPTIIVALFSTIFFNFVIESWFDKRITTALDESVIVAESYLKEHKDVIKVRAKAMAMEIDNNVIYYDLLTNMPIFYEILNSLVDLNSISEAVIFTDNTPIMRSKYGHSLSFEKFPVELFQKATKEEIVIIENDPNKIRAMVQLTSIPNSYLVIGRLIDSNVVNHIQESQGAASKYRMLKNRLSTIQIRFSLIFLAVSMLILIAAIWLGITFSGKITNPIKRLLEATEKIKEGKFSFRVKEDNNNDELSSLAKAFNLMTKHIAGQQEKLLEAYNEIDVKHKFSQAVLSGVSAGIIALSQDKKIILINDSALKLLKLKIKDANNKNIEDLIPELHGLTAQAIKTPEKISSGEINLKIDKKLITILAKVTAETKGKEIDGFIITFDDMTQLVQAQRLAAWSDVARRVAHEVKNPLTPIQLSADRLSKKFTGQVKDSEAFEKYLSTIMRHTGDIAKIIGEFSNFAKMKTPSPEEINIVQLIKDLVTSRQYIDSQIKYSFKCDHEKINLYADQTQITQVIINLLKNAEESIILTPKYKSGKGTIDVKLEKAKKSATILVVDNGKGFDNDTLDRLTEPYFTTRTKGTGLGLAIVQKIIEDHKGKLELFNDQHNHAVVKIELPLN